MSVALVRTCFSLPLLVLLGVVSDAVGQTVINEVRYSGWECYFREFVELKGPGGASLDGYSLVGIAGSDGATYRTIELQGQTIPEDGYFVVGMGRTPRVDFVDDGDWLDSPGAIELRLEGVTVDAVCYGVSGLTCEGPPAEDVPEGTSLARCPDGGDTDDNAADFILDTLGSPGLSNELGNEQCDVPAIVGACCGSCDCRVTSPEECFGDYQGDWTNCDPSPCTSCPPGACCYPDGSCWAVDEVSCACFEGVFQGSDTTCDPNPCPQPTGACCFVDCICQVTEGWECEFEFGGTYLGDDSSCEPSPCECPPGFGACCLSLTCTFTSRSQCDNSGGVFLESLPCEPFPCDPASAPETDNLSFDRLVLRSPEPNPASGPVELVFELGRSRHVRIDLYDASGALVMEIGDGRFGAGSHRWTFDPTAESIASGTYFVRMRSAGEVRTRAVTFLSR